MLLFTEIKYQLFRNRGRTALLACIAALLTGCFAFYVGSIQASENALENLGMKLPVTVKAMSPDGVRSKNLLLNAAKIDALASAGVREERRTVSAAGAIGEEALRQEPFLGGNVSVNGVNCIEAAGLTAEDMTFAAEADPSFLEGSEPVCALNERFADEYGFSVGDTIQLPIYQHLFGSEYRLIAEDLILRVDATFSGASADMLVPEKYLRAETERAGIKLFCYDSYSAFVADPLHLNAFKDSLTAAEIAEVNPAADTNYGEAVIFEDELYIKSAVKLQRNLSVYRSFLIPFFSVIIALVTLAIFLILRSSRWDAAIASSLGRSKLQSGAALFISVGLTDLLGCAAALPVMLLAASLPISACLTICGLFLACGCIGTAIALVFLLRFDTITLLTKVD